jgi:hypothetical protein
MQLFATPRAIALALILSLLALDTVHHVHLTDPVTSSADCSLCASGNHSSAVARIELPPCLQWTQVLAVVSERAEPLLRPRSHKSIRAPPAVSVA